MANMTNELWFTTEYVGYLLNEPKRKIAEKCKNKQLYAIKTEGPFGHWRIPIESLTFYIFRAPFDSGYIDHISNMRSSQNHVLGTSATEVIKFMNNFDIAMFYDEFATFGQVKEIFGDDFPKFVRWYKPQRFQRIFSILRRKRINGPSDLLDFLDQNPDVLHNLEERQKMMLATGDFYEQHIRHLLMLHMYRNMKKQG